jgi:hypothetical protein
VTFDDIAANHRMISCGRPPISQLCRRGVQSILNSSPATDEGSRRSWRRFWQPRTVANFDALVGLLVSDAVVRADRAEVEAETANCPS